MHITGVRALELRCRRELCLCCRGSNGWFRETRQSPIFEGNVPCWRSSAPGSRGGGKGGFYAGFFRGAPAPNPWTGIESVGENESIICLGDVSVDGDGLAYHEEWWRQAPGSKWLVLGNHDVDPVNPEFNADRRAVTVYADGDPPLLLTHIPLQDVPARAVNVHGHLHRQESPTQDRHLSV